MNWRELHDRGVRGDCAALRQLYDSAEGPVFRQCLLACRGDRDAAKDLAQECWTRVFQKLSRLEHPEAFVSWALATASALAASHRRLDHRREALLERFAVEASLDSPLDGESDRLRREALVRECLGAVEDSTHRRLAEAVYVQGQTTRDAAERLGVPHGTVTVTLMRLRARLRARLAEQLATEGFA
jgi:RNA polymerase sigma-70 factor (ECF subfamily)